MQLSTSPKGAHEVEVELQSDEQLLYLAAPWAVQKNLCWELLPLRPPRARPRSAREVHVAIGCQVEGPSAVQVALGDRAEEPSGVQVTLGGQFEGAKWNPSCAWRAV